MATRSSRNMRTLFFRLIRPFHPLWEPLKWLWGIILSGIGLTGSQWLLTKNAALSGTLLGWLVENRSITLSLLGSLLLLTGLARLAQYQYQMETPGVEAEQPLTLSPQQRLQVIRSLQHEYGDRLAHSLQGRVALELGLHERTDMIASSAQLVFHAVDTATEYPVTPGTSITQIYDHAQRGLLILGAPGSGKTTLLLDLVLELLSRAENDPDHPIPIMLNLSSWATRKPTLSDWLKEQLFLVYGIPKRVSISWIAADQVIFLLDGLDEMETSARSVCIEAINAYRGEHLVPLVVCSRRREYENQPERLSLPDAVEIQPLELPRVTAYLKQAGKSLAAVRTVLQNNAILKQLLTTPLMLSIVILTYQGKAAKDLPRLGSLNDQQQQIFSHYVQHILERHQKRGTPSEARLLCLLTWLAQQMQHHHLVDFYLEQLQPTWLATHQRRIMYHLLYGLVVGLLTGLLIGLDFWPGILWGLSAGLIMGAVVGLVAGLDFGSFRGSIVGALIGPIYGGFYWLITRSDLSDLTGILVLVVFWGLFWGFLTGLLTERDKDKLPEKVSWSWRESRKGARLGLVFGLIMGLLSSMSFLLFLWRNLPRDLLPSKKGDFVSFFVGYGLGGVIIALLIAPVFGLIFGLLGGLSSTSMDPRLRREPNQGIRASGWNAVRFSLVFLLTFGLIAGLLGALSNLVTGLQAGLTVGLLGVVFGALFGGGMKYLQHYVLRFFLWRSGVLPWRAVPLLEEATACILLQRVGGGYRFFHPLLQEYFASLATPSTTPSFPASEENTSSP